MLYTRLLCQLYVYIYTTIPSPRDRHLWFNDSFSHFTVYSDLKRIPLLGLEFIFCEVMGRESLGTRLGLLFQVLTTCLISTSLNRTEQCAWPPPVTLINFLLSLPDWSHSPDWSLKRLFTNHFGELCSHPSFWAYIEIVLQTQNRKLSYLSPDPWKEITEPSKQYCRIAAHVLAD